MAKTAKIDPREHIETIRRTKYGLDANPGNGGQNPLSADLHAAVEGLSRDLYSEETHFILELIQNAEDNSYARSLRPRVEFRLLSHDPLGRAGENGMLVLVNNEKGFQSRQVEALCAVGRSTKEKKQGYIGEKGIGFKSVFKVSEYPHIFSNGYRFHFCSHEDPVAKLGYIVPYWVERIPEELDRDADKTLIVLPLLPKKLENIREQLNALVPETILFLHKLRALSVRQADDDATEIVCRQQGPNRVSLDVNGKTNEQYWLLNRECRVPPEIVEEKRRDIDVRDVAVALPLDGRGPEQRVFAFLPTREQSGLPFLINADFLVNAERSRIHRQNAWNEWLRDEIALTFIEAFERLLHDPAHRFAAYRQVPLAEEVKDVFFSPIVARVQESLGERPVVWTADEMLVRPTDARMIDDGWRTLLGEGPWPATMNEMKPVHAEAQKGNRERLRALGVPDFSDDELAACLSDDEWLAGKDVAWYADLYRYLATKRLNKWGLTKFRLESLQIVPVEGGGRVCSEDCSIFLPSADDTRLDVASLPDTDLVRMADLDRDLWEAIKDESDVVQWLDRELGVKAFSLDAFCEAVVDALDGRKSIAACSLRDWTRLLRDAYAEIGSRAQKKVREKMPFRLANGRLTTNSCREIRSRFTDEGYEEWHEDRELVMPENMDPELGWQHAFPDKQDRTGWDVLSNTYLAGCKDQAERERWRKFFKALGSTDAPLPQEWIHEWYGYQPPDHLTPYTHEMAIRIREGSNRSTEITDIQPPRWLRHLNEMEDVSKHTRKRAYALVSWLVRTWGDTGLVRYRMQGSYRYFYYTWNTKSFDTELAHCLKNKAWIPTNKGLRRPDEVFLDVRQVKGTLGDSVPYALADIPESLAEWLGMNLDASGEALLDYLRSLASGPADAVDHDVVRRIYMQLAAQEYECVAEAFQKDALILVTKPEARWVRTDEALWPNESTVFGEVYVYLEREYDRDLRRFFVNRVGVQGSVDESLYAKAMTNLSRQEPTPAAEQVKQALERTFPVLRRVAAADEKPEWWEGWRKDVAVWTQNDRFCPADSVFVPDDGDLRRAFEQQVEFAWCPQKDSFEDYRSVYEAIGVRTLVDSVEIRMEQAAGEQDVKEGRLLTEVAKETVCRFLRTRMRGRYEKLRANGALETFLRTEERTVDELRMTYCLTDLNLSVKADSGAAYWDRNAHVLYLANGDCWDQLAVEVPPMIARSLLNNRQYQELEGVLGRVLGASPAVVKGIVDKDGWKLPPKEMEWVVGVLTELRTIAEDDGSETNVENEKGMSSESAEYSATGEADADVDELGGTAEQGKGEIAASSRAASEKSPGRQNGASPNGASQPQATREPTKGKRKPTNRTNGYRGRRTTYAERDGNGHSGRTHSVDTEAREQITDAAVAHVMAWARNSGFDVRNMNELVSNHPGYDLEAKVGSGPWPEGEGPIPGVKYIEVKGVRDAWDGYGIVLTGTEFDAARQLGSQYLLCVVEHALEAEKMRMYVIQDPAHQPDNFAYDDGWKECAEVDYFAAAG